MFDRVFSIYQLKKQLRHLLGKHDVLLSGWTWEDQLSHHKLHRNFEVVDIFAAAIDRREELKEQKKSRH